MDTKLYIEWRETLKKWVVLYHKEVVSRHDAKALAKVWCDRNYPNHAYETERVIVRDNSPNGVRVGEWL